MNNQEINEMILTIRSEAKVAATSEPAPRFYRDLKCELHFSEQMFFENPVVARCREDVLPLLEDSVNSGVEHAKKVAIEAGAIALAETKHWAPADTRRMCVLAQLAGLLHGICQNERVHAQKSCELAGVILRDYPLSDDDKLKVCGAVGMLEDSPADPNTCCLESAIITYALYDADKFRWGPDNFITTIWEIGFYEDFGPERIAESFSQNLENLPPLAQTFKTRTGRAYGPEFIELGHRLGRKISARLRELAQSDANEK